MSKLNTFISVVAVALALVGVSVAMSVNSNLKDFSEQVKTAFAEVGTVVQAELGGVNNENEEFIAGIRVGTSSPSQFAVDSQGRMTYREQHTTITGTTTLTAAQSGTTFYVSGPTSTVTLPSPSTGLNFRFVTSGSVTGVVKISSVAGDDIDGVLTVNAADVTCTDVDIVNVIDTAESTGDFFELRSDGVQWYIGDSIADTAGALTCTG